MYQFFEDDALLFAAKKTAALSGDIRKAFQICRSAAEDVAKKHDSIDQANDTYHLVAGIYPKIRICDIQRASLNSFNVALSAAVSFSKPFDALLLVAVANLNRTSERESTGHGINEIMSKMEALAFSLGDAKYLPPPSFGETINLITRLAEMNLIEIRHLNLGDVWPVTYLTMDELTLLRGLKSTPHTTLAHKYLSRL
jgi:origin recognition complex subunit 1